MARQRRLVHFAGSVQGVGFRYTAVRLADGYNLRGHVRNLPDGRVECLVEGEPAQIDAFLEQLQHAFRGYIDKVASQNQPPAGELEPFTIRF